MAIASTLVSYEIVWVYINSPLSHIIILLLFWLEIFMEIKLYHIDTLEYSGSILVKDNAWEFNNVNNDFMKTVTKGMPIKGLMASLINFDLVYDIIEE